MSVRTAEEIRVAVRQAAEAAVWAPSVHNTQPWAFGVYGDEITLRADTDRRLPVSDPAGRELLISCGAALFNIRLAVRRMGYLPQVRVLPDPDRPSLVATVRLGETADPDEHTRLLHAEIPRRRTHRAGFTDIPVPEQVVEAMVHQALAEGARLTPVRDMSAVRVLAALTNAAQEVQSRDRAFDLEIIRWARPPGSRQRDGVHVDAYPREAVRTEPYFAQRDYARGRPWGERPAYPEYGHTGLVALLTTPSDGRREWICAGQALQRCLLQASAYEVSAAFHTQALEMYHLREFLRQEICAGEYPQMIIRFGFVFETGPGVRRPAAETLE